MKLLVLEVGAPSLKSLLSSLRMALDECPDRRATLRGAVGSDLDYRAVSSNLEFECRRLQGGELTSLVVEFTDCPVRSAMVFPPEFDNSGLPWWSLYVDFNGQGALRLFDSLLGVGDSLHVVLTVEESLGVTPSQSSLDSFPWDDPRIVKAALRTASGWVVRTPAAGTTPDVVGM